MEFDYIASSSLPYYLLSYNTSEVLTIILARSRKEPISVGFFVTALPPATDSFYEDK